MSKLTNETTLVAANTKAPLTRDLDLGIVALSGAVVGTPWNAGVSGTPWNAGRMGLRATRTVISIA